MFKGIKIVGLTEDPAGKNEERYGFLIRDDEQVKLEYRTIRDLLILTDKRLITVDVQGITGKEIEFFSLGYNKITAFEVETAGTFDIDSRFKIWASGLGDIEFSFLKGTDVRKIAVLLSSGL